jgi:hypothetical protein
MRKLHILFFISAIAILFSAPALAVINNGGGGSHSVPCDDYDGLGYCQLGCANDFNAGSVGLKACNNSCWRNFCHTPLPTSTGNPIRGTGAAPIINGKPVQAPPPPHKGGRPINAAPVVNGGSKAPPSSGGNTILERGGGGGGGRH